MYPWLAASRDGKRRSGDVVGVVGSKIEHGVGDVGGHADAAERRGADRSVFQVLDLAEAGPSLLGFDRARRHGVHGHAILGGLESDAARTTLERRLSHCITPIA